MSCTSPSALCVDPASTVGIVSPPAPNGSANNPGRKWPICISDSGPTPESARNTTRPLLVNITVIEPQCTGAEHAPFNAALLTTASLAFPDAHIRFEAEADHAVWVQDLMRRYPGGSAGAKPELRTVTVPPRSSLGWARVAPELAFFESALARAKATSANVLLFSSITSVGVLALKLASYRRKLPLPVIAVPHSCLSDLQFSLFAHRTAFPLSIRPALSLPHPQHLTYIALGPSIARFIATLRRGTNEHWTAINHPYLFPDNDDSIRPTQFQFRFGFFGGTAHKGGQVFCRLAQDVEKNVS